MIDLPPELNVVLGMAQSLSKLDKVRLVEEVMTLLEEDLTEQQSSPRRSYYGIWPDADVSDDDITDARQEIWGNFPRKDI